MTDSSADDLRKIQLYLMNILQAVLMGNNLHEQPIHPFVNQPPDPHYFQHTPQ